jgi:cytoskeletal protein CcmA (bactofilin family)
MAGNSDGQTGPQTAPAFGNASSSPSTKVPSYLGAGLVIKGQIVGDEDLKVDGKVDGPISLSNHRLTVGPAAQVSGDIVSREIMIYGNVKGKLRGHERVEIKRDSSVLGDVTTPRIMIEDGAFFRGAVEIERATTKAGGADPDTLLALAEKDFKMKSIRSTDAADPHQ